MLITFLSSDELANVEHEPDRSPDWLEVTRQREFHWIVNTPAPLTEAGPGGMFNERVLKSRCAGSSEQ